MNYDQALFYIHSRLRFGIKTGLERVKRLCELIGNPQDKLKFVHVAGTNGKGSTCAMLARIFKTAKLKTGLFISPYITDFCERMQVDGVPIDHDRLAQLTEEVSHAVWQMELEGDYPTEFEIVTAIAFKFFYESGCEYVICETGLGGRLDSTNIIKNPLVTIITAIGMDHMEILGDTIEKIAGEKCGIIKPKGITVCYPIQQPSAFTVIKKSALTKYNRFIVPDVSALRVFSRQIDGSRICYKNEIYNVSLIGEHQIYNAITVIEACHALQNIGVPLHQNDIEHGVLHVDFPCRFEVMNDDPLIIMDGAHNSHAMETLKKTIRTVLMNKNIHLIIGMLGDKDVEKSLVTLLPLCSTVSAVNIDNVRTMSAKDLSEIAKKFCKDCNYDNHFSALDNAVRLAKADGGAVIICGSLYLCSQMRPLVLDYIDNRLK